MKHIGTLACSASIAALLLAATTGLATTRPKTAPPQNPLYPRAPAPLEVQAAAAPVVADALPVAPKLSLKSEAVVRGDIVRLSDLIEGIEAKDDVPMFKAPEIGQIGTIQAARILAAASENAVTGVDTRDLTAVIVRRSGHIVPQDQLLDLVREALARRYSLPPDTDLVSDKGIGAMIVEAEARRSPEIASFTFDPRLNRFEITFTVPGSDITAKKPYRLSGSLGETIRVPIINRQLSKGDVIGPNDFSVETRRRSEFFGEGLVDPVKVTGQIARHGMRVGDIVAASDISKAEWVEKGSLVTLVYETANMSLSTKGRSLGAGGQGDTVTIENLQSKRSVEGTIIGPGKVTVQSKAVQPVPGKTSLAAPADTTPTRTALASEAPR